MGTAASAFCLTCLLSLRLSEPDPSHTLEERVVHWYFKLLDKNSSGDIGKKEIKPFKRFLRKKSKPKKCVKKFVEYCDVNNDKSITVQELMGCLGVTREEGKANTRKRHSKLCYSALESCRGFVPAGLLPGFDGRLRVYCIEHGTAVVVVAHVEMTTAGQEPDTRSGEQQVSGA